MASRVIALHVARSSPPPPRFWGPRRRSGPPAPCNSHGESHRWRTAAERARGAAAHPLPPCTSLAPSPPPPPLRRPHRPGARRHGLPACRPPALSSCRRSSPPCPRCVPPLPVVPFPSLPSHPPPPPVPLPLPLFLSFLLSPCLVSPFRPTARVGGGAAGAPPPLVRLPSACSWWWRRRRRYRRHRPWRRRW